MLPCPVRFCKVDFEEWVKSQEDVAEADAIVAGLLAATVLRSTRPFEPNPAIAHQHRQRVRVIIRAILSIPANSEK